MPGLLVSSLGAKPFFPRRHGCWIAAAVTAAIVELGLARLRRFFAGTAPECFFLVAMGAGLLLPLLPSQKTALPANVPTLGVEASLEA